MIHKTHSPLPNHVRVSFELPSCIWADRIFVVGDFNEWNNQATPMAQDRDGIWRASVEFRYLIDNHWQTDSHADDFATTTLGTDNSVVDANVAQTMRLAERLSSRVSERATGAFATATYHRPQFGSRAKERVRAAATHLQLA
jgi:1,4-alpha-glucan branching enzyme